MPKCKCGQEIRWIKMVSGKSMPVDEKKQKMILLGSDLPEGTISNFQPDRGHVITVYMPHWATCRKAKDFKRGK